MVFKVRAKFLINYQSINVTNIFFPYTRVVIERFLISLHQFIIFYFLQKGIFLSGFKSVLKYLFHSNLFEIQTN